MTVSIADIQAAAKVIRGVADNTPLVPSPFLSALTGQEFLLKLENMQPIGAFKIRGAMTAIMNLDADAPGVTCCSTGNHGRGVAFAAARRGLRAVICMSNLVPQAKIDGIKALGGEVKICGGSQDQAQEECLRLVANEGLVEISPFDDAHVIAGQGTIGLEILAARPDIKTILVPLSGGGLAGGIALAAKAIDPGVRVIGISMDRGAAMYLSLQAGRPVDVTEYASLADSLGGGIGLENQLSFDLCREHLDEVLLVSEEDIYHAMQTLFYEDRLIAEGASVVGIAALLAGKLTLKNGPAVAVITGRNLNMSIYADIVAGRDVLLGEKTIKGRDYGQ